jgi:hypothetical protein
VAVRVVAVAVSVTLGTLAAGCGEHLTHSPPPAGTPAVALVITETYGSRVLYSGRAAAGQTIMAALSRAVRLDTTYGGRYVQAINGIAGSLATQHDWLFFVNGVESPVGASDVTLRVSDRVWWDYRAWGGGYLHVAAVVGAWPEPFLHANASASRRVSADAPFATLLARHGARITTTTAAYRVLVGADASLRRRDPDWAAAEAAPQTHGLTVWISNGQVRVWDAATQTPRIVVSARSVIAAYSTRGGGVGVAVAGITTAAAAAAAAALARDATIVAHRYAVALDGSGRVVATGGV